MRGKLRLGLSLSLFAVKQEDSEPCPPYPSMVLKGSSEITNVRYQEILRGLCVGVLCRDLPEFYVFLPCSLIFGFLPYELSRTGVSPLHELDGQLL